MQLSFVVYTSQQAGIAQSRCLNGPCKLRYHLSVALMIRMTIDPGRGRPSPLGSYVISDFAAYTPTFWVAILIGSKARRNGTQA